MFSKSMHIRKIKERLLFIAHLFEKAEISVNRITIFEIGSSNIVKPITNSIINQFKINGELQILGCWSLG